jgi:hypothetical protein
VNELGDLGQHKKAGERETSRAFAAQSFTQTNAVHHTRVIALTSAMTLQMLNTYACTTDPTLNLRKVKTPISAWRTTA